MRCRLGLIALLAIFMAHLPLSGCADDPFFGAIREGQLGKVKKMLKESQA